MHLDSLKLKSPYLYLDEEFYKFTQPIPLENPYLIHFNSSGAKLLNIKDNQQNKLQFIELANGTLKPDGVQIFSMCYAGHQFGNYIPRLGDGRAHNLGKIDKWNLQTKGSGETPYANLADGRCTLASSIREYLMAEAMYHLGIPTTRSLGIIGSDTKIVRNQIEKAAITMRLSTSWIRFGTFEYFYYLKANEKLEQLADFVIQESYPHLHNVKDKYYKLFCEIIQKTAKLLAKWQAIGFCHGVLNTDNISIEGLTLDYGPFSMMDEFNYNYICNTTDKAGRYAYGEQVNVMYWNLTKLSKTFIPLVTKDKLETKLNEFEQFIYFDTYIDEMRKKLGLFNKQNDDKSLIEKLIKTLHESYVDYTQFFRLLSKYRGDKMPLYEIAMEPVVLDDWLKLYDKRLQKETLSQEQRLQKMSQINPKYILKNYMLDMAIKKAQQQDFSMVETLIYIAQHPFDELAQYEHFTGDIPQEYQGLLLSCSS